MAIIDCHDIVGGVLWAGPNDADRPPQEQFDAAGGRAAAAIERNRMAYPRAWRRPLGKKRGDFVSMTAGINYNYTDKVRALQRRKPMVTHPSASSARRTLA